MEKENGKEEDGVNHLYLLEQTVFLCMWVSLHLASHLHKLKECSFYGSGTL